MSLALQGSRRYDLESARFFADPESTFGIMRERDPVYFDPALSAWILTRYDDVSEALRSSDLSVDRNGEIGRGRDSDVAPRLHALNGIVGSWMVFSDPPRHTRLRGLVARAFQPSAVNKLRGEIARTVDELLDGVGQAGGFDALADLGVPLSERITAHLLGLPEDSPPQLKRWTENLFQFVGVGTASDALVHASADGVDACRAFVTSVVRARALAPRNDLVSQIVRDAEGEFTEEEIVGVVITLIAGAYETTSHTIANGMYALLRHPEQLAHLREDPGLIDSAVEEVFRFDGPSLSVQRRATRALSIRGASVNERDRVYCMLHAANHDPAAFPRPSEFDVARSPCRHLGLGLGPHFCLGAWLTRLETQLAVLRTVQRFPNLRQAPGSAPQWVANFAIRGLSQLRLSISAT